MTHSKEIRVQLAGMLAIAAATTAVFWIADGVGSALITGALMFGFVTLVHLGRSRSPTLESLGGIGDERTRGIYARASALTAAVLSFVIPGWWLVTVAIGEPNTTLAILGAVFGATFVAAVAFYERRG